MANKNIQLHPVVNGAQDTSTNLYPKTTADNIVDKSDRLQDKLISGTNIKTVNGNSLLGSGNVEVLSTAHVENDTLIL